MPLLINILVLLIVVGALLYIIQLLPLDSTIKQIAYVLALVIVAIWLLNLLVGGVGVWPWRAYP